MAWRVELYDCGSGFDITQLPVDSWRYEGHDEALGVAQSLQMSDTTGALRYGVLVYDEHPKTGSPPSLSPGEIKVWSSSGETGAQK